MTIKYSLGVVFFTVILLCTSEAETTVLSGEFLLDNQDLLVSDTQKYKGTFDLRSKLPMGEDFVLTKVIITFEFQDDKEWVRKAGPNSLEKTGKIIRHKGASLRNKSIAGQTDHYYTAKTITYLSNEEEIVELSIGSNIYYSTSIRWREVTTESLGSKSIPLGIYHDEGDNHRLRQHYRITESIAEEHRDGYDGQFRIKRIKMDLATIQDLAHTGLLDFELGGRGDYIFDEALLQYKGYFTEQEVNEGSDDGVLSGPIWFALVSLPLGGFLWRKKKRGTRGRKMKKLITQRKIPQHRDF